jgi:hypothetical protein
VTYPTADVRDRQLGHLAARQPPTRSEGYSIEVFNAVGDTVAVTVVDQDAIEALQSDEVLSVRRIKSAAA